MAKRDCAAVIVAAGLGKRLGAGKPKAHLALKGRWMLEWPLRAMLKAPSVNVVALVVLPGAEKNVSAWLKRRKLDKHVLLVAGGKERQDSVRHGLQAVKELADFALVHDAARPFLNVALIEDCAKSARRKGSGIAAVPVKDSIKQKQGSKVKSLPRETLWAAQTPQAARVDWLLMASLKAKKQRKLLTDEAGLLEWARKPVALVESYDENFKVTTPRDLEAAKKVAGKFFK